MMQETLEEPEEEAIEPEAPIMDKEDAKEIQKTDEFGKFFEKAAKYVMRGLNFESICRLDYGDKHSIDRGEMLVESHFEPQ